MKYFSRVLFLFMPAVSLSQSPSSSPSVPLNFKSYAISLGVSKDGNLVLTSMAGEIGMADSINGQWRKVTKSKGLFGQTFEQSNFFNKDTGFISGDIDGKGYSTIIYHTTNGGRKWKPVKTGVDGWSFDAVHLDNGEAWMAVAGYSIAYSSDYGFTWKKFKSPYPEKFFSILFFNTARQGLIGSRDGWIAYTGDNCRSWERIPTPLDQCKYDKIYDYSPLITKVGMYKDYFLVVQDDFVFYSKKDSVNWVWLRQYDDFYVDPASSAIFFKTNDFNYVYADDNFHGAYTYPLRKDNFDAECRNGNLFLVTDEEMIRLGNNGEIVSSLFSNISVASSEPEEIGYSEKGSVGITNNKIYFQDEYGMPWKYGFTFPYPYKEGKLSVVNGNMLLFEKGDSLFYLSLAGKIYDSKSKTAMIHDFCTSGMQRIIFEQGSRGCYHHWLDKLVFTNNRNGTFSGQIEYNSHPGKTDGMPSHHDSIAEADVNAFLQKIPYLWKQGNMASIQDLAFTEKEYEQCRNDILAYKTYQQMGKAKLTQEAPRFYLSRNNIDFNRLIGVVDSIKMVDQAVLTKTLLDLDDMSNATTYWKTVRLVNNEKDVLSITYYYSAPGSFYLPWKISLNGYEFMTTSMDIQRFLQKVYPSFLDGQNRMRVLHALVRKLY